MLQKAGLRDSCFIAMSNYYYDEKTEYLAALAEVRTSRGRSGESNHDLTPFLVFGLKGVALQSKRLIREIRTATLKLLYRDMMRSLSERLYSPRKRVITQRQFGILEILLAEQSLHPRELIIKTLAKYNHLRAPFKAFVRDINALLALRAITWGGGEDDLFVLNLNWPMFITESKFYKVIEDLPRPQYTFTSRR